jgi:hypothetical protein
MKIQLIEFVQPLLALVTGAAIGFLFGAVQNAALRRHEKLQQGGKLNSGWTVVPGSMRRVASLVVALALVQVVCPVLFIGGSQWWVSAGVVGSYGWLLFSQLRQRKTNGI